MEENNWKCPVCQELLYKPVVPPCGHPFCFWCAHRSMSYTSVSKCPLCRSEFTHLPRVSEVLQELLAKAFPATYKVRAEETQVLEDEQEIASCSCTHVHAVEVPKDGTNCGGLETNCGDVETNSADLKESYVDNKAVHKDRDMFKCDCCSEVLFEPAIVSPCAHCLCGKCAGLWKEESDASGDVVSHCPVCKHQLVASPKVCYPLNDLLDSNFGKEIEMRKKGLVRVQKQAPDLNVGGKPSSPGTPELMETREEEQKHRMLQERIIKVLKSPCDHTNPEDYVHFGVGCDGCGVCPIVGHRYKCLECEEKIGFDLCSECHTNHVGPGRFNQQHKPDHKMVLVEPKETVLHSLLKNHPGFTIDYLLDLVNGMYNS